MKAKKILNILILCITILLLANLFSPYLQIQISECREGPGAHVSGIIEYLLGEEVHSDGVVSISAVGLARNVEVVMEGLKDEKLLVVQKLLQDFLAGPLMILLLLFLYGFFILIKRRWKYLILSAGTLASGSILLLGPFVLVPRSIISYINSLLFFNIPDKYLSVKDMSRLILPVMGWGYWVSVVLLFLLMILSFVSFFIYKDL